MSFYDGQDALRQLKRQARSISKVSDRDERKKAIAAFDAVKDENLKAAADYARLRILVGNVTFFVLGVLCTLCVWGLL